MTPKPERIPITDAESFARANGLKQVIILGWDGATTFRVTWGESKRDCDQAAKGAEAIEKFLGIGHDHGS